MSERRMVVLDRAYFTAEAVHHLRKLAAHEQREAGRGWRWSPSALIAAFDALPTGATPDAVAAAWGEDQAIRTYGGCDVCGRYTARLVRFGAHPAEYDASTEDVCLACLTAATQLLEAP